LYKNGSVLTSHSAHKHAWSVNGGGLWVVPTRLHAAVVELEVGGLEVYVRERERERKAVSGVNVTRIHVTRRAGVRGESSRWTHRQSVIQR